METLMHKGIVRRLLDGEDNKLSSLCNALSPHRYIFLAVLTCLFVSVQSLAAGAEQNTALVRATSTGRDTSAFARPARRLRGSRNSMATAQAIREKADSAAETNTADTGIKLKQAKLKRLKKVTGQFAEVEIAVNDKFSLEYVSALPMAPGSDLEVLGDGKHVKVQLPVGQVKALADEGADIKVLRNFVLVEGFTSEAESLDSSAEITSSCSGNNEHGESNYNVYIYDSFTWYGSGIDFSGIAEGATVSCIDIHYIIDPSWSFVDVAFSDEDYNSYMYMLEDYEWGGDGDIYNTRRGITAYNGEAISQMWILWALEYTAGGSGYIDYWWIKLYYEGHCTASGGCAEHISRVETGDIDNSSGCSGYSDYTALSTEMAIGESYDITITNGDAYPDDQCGIWIDWNKDEDFDDPDPNETVQVGGGPDTFTTTINVPADANEGDVLMRIRIIDSSADPLLKACGTTQWGEVEDYTITVTSSIPGYCSASGGCDYISGNEYISGVQVGEISTFTFCGNYTHYTSITTIMGIGIGYPITVYIGNGLSNDKGGLWVDWNQDLDFNDADEAITTAWSGAGPYEVIITPPAGAALGETRMRVRLQYGGTPSPCGDTSLGEVEDYTISVTESVTISGYVKTGMGAGIEGVLVSASTGGSDTTDTNGYYELAVLSGTTGSITPSKELWTFGPEERYYFQVTEDVPNVDFTGTYTGNPNPTISGYILTDTGDGIRDVLVSADSGESATTDSDGYYELTLLTGPIPSPWSGTITPSKTYWSFEPPDRTYENVTEDTPNADFTGTYTANPQPMVSGYIKTAEEFGIEGVQVSGDLYSGSTMTDENGYYELTIPYFELPVPSAWTGTLTPTKTDWSFEPPDISYVDLGYDMSEQNYIGTYIGAGCDSGWIEEWVARYHADDERQYYLDEAHDMAVDELGNIYVAGQSYRRIGDEGTWDGITIKYNPNGDKIWAANYNGPTGGSDDFKAIAVDSSGNAYVTGTSWGDFADYLTIKYGPDSNEPVWVARYNGPENGSDKAEAIAIDDADNIYVTGRSFGIGTDNDYATIKYDSDGNEVWVSRYNGSANSWDVALAIAVDNIGNVYVTGGSAGIGTEDDCVTIKYDSDGNEVWVARYNGPGNSWDSASAIAIDDFGNVYVTGGSAGIGTEGDYATIKYDPNGNELWFAGYNGPANDHDWATEIAVDDYSNVYVSGSSRGVDTGTDYATVKYASDNGDTLWIARYNGPEDRMDRVLDMCLDDSGNVYITGISDYLMPTTQQPGLGDFVTIKYGPDSSEPLWVARYEGPPNSLEGGMAIGLDSLNNVYVAGNNDAYVTIKYSQCLLSLSDMTLDNQWMYQNLPGQTNSNLTASVSIIDDPAANNSYSYVWEFILPSDVFIGPMTVDGGGPGDAFCTFASLDCDVPLSFSLSNSGQPFTVKVTVTGVDYGNTATAEAQFGIALLGDVNNNGRVNLADRSIINSFWKTGSVGACYLRDCDVNCNGYVNIADRSIANSIWKGTLGQNAVSEPCPLRSPCP